MCYRQLCMQPCAGLLLAMPHAIHIYPKPVHDSFGQRRAQCVHVVIGGAALPNAASIALHERLGFEYVGTLREVGWKFERWIDVGYWQLRL